jgi:hypothetical protein
MTKNNLQHFYCEGYHRLAEATAARLELELDLPKKPLLERLNVSGQETEEAPENFPPVGLWDPEFLRYLRSSPDTMAGESVGDHQSIAPTLLVDSDGETIRSGPAFEYWSRVTATLGTNEIAPELSGIPNTGKDQNQVEDWFQNMISTFKSRTTTITFPIHSQNIATVQEMVAYDGFQSIVIKPTSPAELPIIVIGRHEEALRQFTRAIRGSLTSRVRGVLDLLYLGPFSVYVAIMLVVAAWYCSDRP